MLSLALLFLCVSCTHGDSLWARTLILKGTDDPTTPTPTTSPPRCPSYPPPPALAGKKGIGLTLREPPKSGNYITNMPKVQALQVHWNYAWSPDIAPNQSHDIDFMPMMWGANEARLQGLADRDWSGTKRFLGFNEPDSPQQSNVPVNVAVERWKYLEALNVSLVSPSAAQPMGDWFAAFMERAEADCLRVDAIGAHWYGPPNLNDLVRKMTLLYELYQRPILLTEFAVADWQATTVEDNRYTPERVLRFLQEAITWLEETTWMDGYAWFNFGVDRPQGWSSALFDRDGNPTALGAYYASV